MDILSNVFVRLLRRYVIGIMLLVALLPACKSPKEEAVKPRDERIITKEIALGNIEVGLETDESLKALTLRLEGRTRPDGTNAYIPVHEIPDGTIIPVHTAIANSAGSVYGAATLNWRYNKATKKLRLEGDNYAKITLRGPAHEFYVGANYFWMTGIIGGQLSADGSNVMMLAPEHYTPTPRINPHGYHVRPNMPFGFKWTMVYVQQGAEGNHATPIYSMGKNSVAFSPMGSVIGIRIQEGVEDFLATEYIVNTNAWHNSVFFNLRHPMNNYNGFPTWAPVNQGSGCNPSTAQHYKASEVIHTYNGILWVWVMPNMQVLNTDNTYVTVIGRKHHETHNRIMFVGKAEKPLSGGGTQAWRLPQYGKVHQAILAHRPLTGFNPLMYLKEYPLHGGSVHPGLVYYSSYGWVSPHVQGELRDADYQIGLENWKNTFPSIYKYYDIAPPLSWHALVGATVGRYPPRNYNIHNMTMLRYPNTPVRLGDYYYAPEVEDWWSIVPRGTDDGKGIYFAPEAHSRDNGAITQEFGRIGGEDLNFRYTAACSFTQPSHEPVPPYNTQRAVYALRLLKPPHGTAPREILYHDGRKICYPVLENDRYTVAFRYELDTDILHRHVGSRANKHILRIESIYLGEEGLKHLPSRDGYGVRAVWGQLAALTGNRVEQRNICHSRPYRDWRLSTNHPPGRGCFYWSKTLRSSDRAWVFSVYKNELSYEENTYDVDYEPGVGSRIDYSHPNLITEAIPVILFKRPSKL